MSNAERTAAEFEHLLDRRDWEVHFWRWDFNELVTATDPAALLEWLPAEVLDTVILPTNRTLRAHLELVKREHTRISKQPNERMHAAHEQKLTDVQLRRKFDPLTGIWTCGNPEDG